MTNLATLIDEKSKEVLERHEGLTMKQSIEKLTGLPNMAVPEITASLSIKNGFLDPDANHQAAPAMFDIFIVAATLGFAEGLRIGRSEATSLAKPASESAS